jgi:hypothetical protein
MSQSRNTFAGAFLRPLSSVNSMFHAFCKRRDPADTSLSILGISWLPLVEKPSRHNLRKTRVLPSGGLYVSIIISLRLDIPLGEITVYGTENLEDNSHPFEGQPPSEDKLNHVLYFRMSAKETNMRMWSTGRSAHLLWNHTKIQKRSDGTESRMVAVCGN